MEIEDGLTHLIYFAHLYSDQHASIQLHGASTATPRKTSRLTISRHNLTPNRKAAQKTDQEHLHSAFFPPAFHEADPTLHVKVRQWYESSHLLILLYDIRPRGQRSSERQCIRQGSIGRDNKEEVVPDSRRWHGQTGLTSVATVSLKETFRGPL